MVFIVQRQQYPHVPDDEIKQRAEFWKASDENEQHRRRASYQESIAQQQAVSDASYLSRLLKIEHVLIKLSLTADTPHYGLVKPTKKNVDE